MTDITGGKRDFFISFNKADRPWATWIAWILEENGYRVWFQDWDFRPGHNFVLEMNRVATLAERTVPVLSPNFLASRFTQPEWAAAFADDPTGEQGRVVPVRVAECDPKGLLGPIVYIDLVGREEAKAKNELLRGVQRGRAKPPVLPDFPGGAKRTVPEKPSFPGVVHNLPLYNPDFVGRKQVLTELHRRFTSGRGSAVPTQVITGLGGVGKTQTALAYCYRYLVDYTLVWWLRAGTPGVLATDFIALAESLGLDRAAAGQEELITKIRTELQSRKGWLLVFDSLDEDLTLLRMYLPETGKGHALITSHRIDWKGIAKPFELKVMEEGEALQLLTGRPDPNTLSDAERVEVAALGKELGYLPLALAQAQAYMAGAGKSVASYRRILQESRRTILERGRVSPDDPKCRRDVEDLNNDPMSVAEIWEISIRAAERGCAAARPLLELLAFFASDPLPTEILANKEPAMLPEGLRDEPARDNAIEALKRYSLIQAEKDTITVLHLVQAVIRDGLDPAIAQARAEVAVRLVNAALRKALQDPDNHTRWPKFRTLLPHALATVETAEHFKVSLEVVGTVLNSIGNYRLECSAFAEAKPLYQRALKIREAVLGPEHPDVAQSLHDLAELYRAQGRYGEAKPLYKRALKIREAVLGPEHPDVAQSLHDLAELYRAQGRYGEAESLHQQALAIREKVFGPEHQDIIAWSLRDLAELYRAQGRYAKAEPLLEHALAIQERELGPEHVDVAWSLSHLAELHCAQGHYAKAEPLYQRALATQERELGPEHLDIAYTCHGFAELYRAQSRYAKAKPLYQRALKIRQTVLESEHPDVAESLHGLAELYYAQGHYAKAEPLYQRALEIQQKVLGPEHPDVARSLCTLAELYRVQGRCGEAESLCQEAVAIWKKVSGSEHPDVATICSFPSALDAAPTREGSP